MELLSRTKSRYKNTITWVLSTVGLLLGVLLLCYVLRNLIASKLIEYVGQEQDLQVTCADIDINWRAHVSVDALCLELPNVHLAIKNAVWQPFNERITIASVHVQHLQTASTEKNNQGQLHATVTTELPATLPQINIEQLSIDSPLLSKTVNLSVQLGQAKILQIHGDIEASLQATQHHWSADITWRLADLIPMFPAAKALSEQYSAWLSDELVNSAHFSSQLNFDGDNLLASHKLNIEGPLLLPGCNLQVDLRGQLDTQLPLFTKHLTLDLSQLHSELDLSECETVPADLRNGPLKHLNIIVPQPVHIDGGQLHLAELTLVSITPEGQEQNKLLVNRLRYDFNDSLSADYRLTLAQSLDVLGLTAGQLNLKSSGKVSFNLNTWLNDKDMHWEIQQGQAQLRVQNLGFSDSMLSDLQANMSLSGNHTTGIELAGDLQAEQFSGSGIGLAQLSGQFELTLDREQQLKLLLSSQLHSPVFQQFSAANADNHMQLSAVLSGNIIEQGLFGLSQLQLQMDSTLNSLQSSDVSAQQLTSHLQLEGDQPSALQFVWRAALSHEQGYGAKVSKIQSQLQGSVSDLRSVEFWGQTAITGLSIAAKNPQLSLQPITINHQGQSELALANTFSQHSITLEKDLKITVNQQADTLALAVSQQKISSVQALIRQFVPQLTLTGGLVDGTFTASLDSVTQAPEFVADISLSEIQGRYEDYLFNGGVVQAPISFNSAGLQLGETILSLGSLNIGLPIEHIKAVLNSSSGDLSLDDITGHILGGQFRIKQIWLDQRAQSFDVVIENIDLAQVVALQDQPGISITGHIAGSLPVDYAQQQIGVNEGEVVSQGGGVLTIRDNPAFDNIKQQQSELAFLENYHFSQLASKVSLKPDGWLFLELAFQGENPDKKQAVNFNYSHQENLFTLMETLKVTNSIQQKIEQSISKGGE